MCLPTAGAMLSYLLLHFILTVSVSGRPEFVALIPNGFRGDDPTAGIGCLHLGHMDCIPGAPRNQFGLDFKAAGYKWTKELCQTDSDGDGLTNGEELGDPCCDWFVGSDIDLPATGLSHPGDPDNTTNAPQPSCAEDPLIPTPSPSPSTEATDIIIPTSSSEEEPEYIGPSFWPDLLECFPAESLVMLADGSRKSIQQVQVGDFVQVGPSKFSPVFMFTHRFLETVRPFTVLTTSRANISLTAGHFIYVNDKLVPAEQAQPGDFIELHDGSKHPILNIRTQLKKGLFNPQTVHGDIVVNGIRASTYTKAVAPPTAHTLLTPLRFLFRFTGWYTSAMDSGVEHLIR